MIMPVKTITLLLFLIGIFALQIFFSKKESRWLGLILPGINVLFSVIAVLGMAFYLNEPLGQIVMQILSVLVIYNIPTFVLLAIYFACREKRKKNKEIDKMNIQDLE
ncbi:MAG: hypothetical protein APF77_04120 [Clostridia bacterium BRH_c25]|nr:MAG: hypothetical protein APF77_04120 [Clostridia bacterium BRH_c25]